MSRPVELVDVRRRIEEFGPVASLITIGADTRPHVVSVVVELLDELLRVRVGGRTRSNLVDRPQLTLTWHPSPGGDYMLILDGVAASIGVVNEGASEVAVRVESGILHGLAGPASNGGVCLTL